MLQFASNQFRSTNSQTKYERTMWRYINGGSNARRFLSTSSIKAFRWWDHVRVAQKDPIVGVTEAFLSDPFPHKINLGVGTYRDDEGKPFVPQCVRDAEAKIGGCKFEELNSSAVNSKFVLESVKLAYGNDSHVVREGLFAGVPTLSGTGACRLFAEFQRNFYPNSQIYLPNPTWSNHRNIWRQAEIPVKMFHYYQPDTKGLDFAALMKDVKNAPDGSFFLLHPCAHNPTGVDPTEEQWKELSYELKVKNHFPFFDMAYQGFASGDLDKDAQALRIFFEDGHLIGCAQSFAKNMGLYGHKVGCLSVLCNDKEQAAAMKSQLQNISLAMYSSLPIHGTLLVSMILSDPDMEALWRKELKAMAKRIQTMRASFRQNLENLDSTLNWEHITTQVGMFCFSGLSPDQVKHLEKDFHIYMTPDGRISMAGVTRSNVNYLANAIDEVTKMAASKSAIGASLSGGIAGTAMNAGVVIGRRRSERRERVMREGVFGSARLRFPHKRDSHRCDSEGRIGNGGFFGQKPAEELVILLYLELELEATLLLTIMLCFLTVHLGSFFLFLFG
ncbi:aspartate aminotransferase, mitochondrial-like [Senna tora]|uniref:aspartate transaminase n=1 Tax=Senna tora TaxID=362788 RepID=A0A834TQI4_9FABA|nr:aspartate aminotransferase, mitochondrial-like [Senna tora]